ncbi:MAG: hypothetical protein ACK4IS_01145 [Erythrobacter sp.]
MDSADLDGALSTGHTLAHEVARSARTASAALPVLRHLLASDGPTLVNEAVVARVRGMLRDLAAQIIAGGRGGPAAGERGPDALDALAEHLAQDDALLAHVHALALEGQLAERFEQRLSLDPVLSPLLQELIASDDAMVAELAMTTLAAQARFLQSQRRMELPLHELPADLLRAALEQGGSTDHAVLASYDESATRLALLARLIKAMRRAVVACLAFDRAGLALFAEGLAAQAGIARSHAVLACHDGQAVRLALALRAADCDLAGIERQLLLISAPGPELAEIAALTPQQARARLADAFPASAGEGR